MTIMFGENMTISDIIISFMFVVVFVGVVKVSNQLEKIIELLSKK